MNPTSPSCCLQSAIETGDPKVAGDLLPLVDDEQRKLAAARLAAEKQGQTLQPTALRPEAYVCLVRGRQRKRNVRRHFFAAAEAMRRSPGLPVAVRPSWT